MKEMLNPAQEGLTAEYYRSPMQRERDEQRNQAILENEFRINPDRNDYASISIEKAFNWMYVREKIAQEYGLGDELPLFIFAFYSDPKPGADRELLNDADIEAFLEARQTKPDDFLYYFRGETDDNGNVMSFCVWTTPEASLSVIHGEAHQRAAKLAKPSYNAARVQGRMMALADNRDEIVFSDPIVEHALNVG